MSAVGVKLGVGVIIVRDGKVLLGKRLSAHGHHTWGFPGGAMKYQEKARSCARRETKEETGLEVLGMKEARVILNTLAESQEHWITHFIEAEVAPGEPQLCEPDKCAGWKWFSWTALPQPLFLPVQALYETGFIPTQLQQTA